MITSINEFRKYINELHVSVINKQCLGGGHGNKTLTRIMNSKIV